jgi:SAM-dependent methyltransferase
MFASLVDAASRIRLSGRKDSRETDYISEYVLSKTKARECLRVVDIGCGDGKMLSMLDRGERVGVTPFSGELDILRPAVVGAEFYVGTSTSIPISDNWADLVIVHGVFPVLSGDRILEKSMDEFARILRQNGTLWVGDAICGFNDEFKLFGSRKLGFAYRQLLARNRRYYKQSKKSIRRLETTDNVFPRSDIVRLAGERHLITEFEEPAMRWMRGKVLLSPTRRNFMFRKAK